MDLVVDANILFSALIKDGLNYQFLFDDRFHLFTPEYIFAEFENHKEEIIEKTERTTEEFFRLIEILKRRMIIIPLEELTEYINKAEQITPDPNDFVYFALALKLKCAIWSNDKELKNKQNIIKVYNTSDLLNL